MEHYSFFQTGAMSSDNNTFGARTVFKCAEDLLCKPRFFHPMVSQLERGLLFLFEDRED